MVLQYIEEMMKRFKDSKDTGIQLVLNDDGNDESDEVSSYLIDLQTIRPVHFELLSSLYSEVHFHIGCLLFTVTVLKKLPCFGPTLIWTQDSDNTRIYVCARIF